MMINKKGRTKTMKKRKEEKNEKTNYREKPKKGKD